MTGQVCAALSRIVFCFSSTEAIGEAEGQMNAADPPGLAFHDLLDGYLHSTEIHGHIPGFYPHDRRHTGAQGGSKEIGGGEALAFPLVVDRGVGLDHRARL